MGDRRSFPNRVSSEPGRSRSAAGDLTHMWPHRSNRPLATKSYSTTRNRSSNAGTSRRHMFMSQPKPCANPSVVSPWPCTKTLLRFRTFSPCPDHSLQIVLARSARRAVDPTADACHSSAASSLTAASASLVISSSATYISFTAARSCLLSSWNLRAFENAATVPKPVIP